MSTTDETILNEELQTTDSTNEWEQKYKELQKDYTRKSQELASLKKQPQSSDDDEDARSNLDEQLAKRGYVKRDALDWISTRLKQEQEFNKLLDIDPELKKFSEPIKKIAESEWLSYEDVITKYWFKDQETLAKAKERSLIGNRVIDTKPKSIDDMTDAEYQAYKKQIMSSTSSFSEISKF
jgi:hypothetical protein